MVAEWVRFVLGLILSLGQPTLEGVATYYALEAHEGKPLYCDQFMAQKLVYDEARSPWFAVDVGEYQAGRIRCGEWFLLVFDDGSQMVAQALDAGRFNGRWVEGLDGPIVVDLPEHLHPNRGTILVRAYRLVTKNFCNQLLDVTTRAKGGGGADD